MENGGEHSRVTTKTGGPYIAPVTEEESLTVGPRGRFKMKEKRERNGRERGRVEEKRHIVRSRVEREFISTFNYYLDCDRKMKTPKLLTIYTNIQINQNIKSS